VGIRDIGADEFNSDNEITNGPMNEKHAGPTAPETYAYETSVTTSVHALPTNKITISPEPICRKNTNCFLVKYRRSDCNKII